MQASQIFSGLSSLRVPAAGLFLLLFSAFALSVPFSDGPGASGAFQEGEHYIKLPVPIGTVASDKVEVREFFSYACPHCFQFESVIHPWIMNLPKDVVFQRTPAIFRPDWEPLARAYFVSEALGVTDKTHTAIFSAIHVNKETISTEEDVAAIFVKAGVSPAAFQKAYRSFGVGTQVKQASAKLKLAQVTGVPNLLVNGKFLVPTQQGQGFDAMLRVVDYLVEMELGTLTGK